MGSKKGQSTAQPMTYLLLKTITITEASSVYILRIHVTDHVSAGEKREALGAEVSHRGQLREQGLRVGAHQAKCCVE